MAMTNDGTQAYDHQKDGMTQQLAGCLRDFRNKPFPVKAKIQYYMNTLTVGKLDVIRFSSTFEEALYIPPCYILPHFKIEPMAYLFQYHYSVYKV